jgi:hypothetical protein
MTRWEQINRIRSSYVPVFTNNFQDALKKQIQPITEQMMIKPISQIDINIDKQPIEDVFMKLYISVGMDFSYDTLNRMTGKSRKAEYDDIWQQELLNYVKLYLGDRIVSITGTTKDVAVNIMKDIAESQIIPQGIGIEEANRIIQREFKDNFVKTTLARSRVIAQTEILTASNKGSHLGAQGAGAKYKIWQTSGIPDPEGKERHVAYPGLHGQKRNMGDAYSVGGSHAQFPGDSSLPVGDVVNCKCAEIYE